MPQTAETTDISNGPALVTSSQAWIMQFASAVVLAAFATIMWVAGQHFIQREAYKQSGTSSILGPAPKSNIGKNKQQKYVCIECLSRQSTLENPEPTPRVAAFDHI
jgi:hypothetical protein